MNIVFSRPMWSDTQPKNGRQMPLSTRSIDNANVRAGSVNPRIETGNVVDLKVLGDRRELRGCHQTAGAHQDEHRVHHPEYRRLEHLPRAIITPGLLNRRSGRQRDFARLWRPQQQCDQHHDDALPKPEPEERRFIATRLDHIGDRHDGERRAGAKTGGGQTRGQAAPVGEPLQRIADRGAVDDAGADAADRRADIEQCQRIRDRR